jgi:glyoxylase-like metal-dependent hydrolase (beta-lactamase superfamily II)
VVGIHPHADHITGLVAPRDRTGWITMKSDRSKVDVVSIRVADGEQFRTEGLALDVTYMPGHTDD